MPIREDTHQTLWERGGSRSLVTSEKTQIMASGPTTSWQTDGEIMETVTDFIILGFKITVDGDCSHEIKNAHSLEEKL